MAEKDAVYQIIADRIDSALAAGVAPWRKAWKTDGLSASNLFSKHAYSGVNVWLLAAWSMTRPEGAPAPFYATFNQVRAKGGHVKKGEKGIPVVFWRFLKREDKETGKEVKIPLLRYYTVFNVEAQTEGLEKFLPVKVAQGTVSAEAKHEAAEAICARYEGGEAGPKVLERQSDRAYYQHNTDTVVIPMRSQYDDLAEFYAVRFHEDVHSTGHDTRLNRSLKNGFGSEAYGREELAAEMGAAFLLGACGLDGSQTIDNAAAYIAGWRSKIKSDPRCLVVAAGAAQKAVNLILGVVPEEKEEED
jgi:antirestriction protein ArdC